MAWPKGKPISAEMRAKLTAGRQTWDGARLQLVRDLLAQGWLGRDIAREMGITRNALKIALYRHGERLREAPDARAEAARDVLRQHYETERDLERVRALYCAALGRNTSAKTMRWHAQKMGLRRAHFRPGHGARTEKYSATRRIAREAAAARVVAHMAQTGLAATPAAAALGIGKTAIERMMRDGLVPTRAKAEPKRDYAALAARIKGRMAAGETQVEAMRAEGANKWAAGMMQRAGLLPRLRRPKAQKPAKAAPQRPAGWVREVKPAPAPAPRTQSVEEFLAAGGRITRCPAVMAVECQATIPEADRAAMTALYAERAAVERKQARGVAMRAQMWGWRKPQRQGARP